MLDLIEKALTLQRICEMGNHRHEIASFRIRIILITTFK